MTALGPLALLAALVAALYAAAVSVLGHRRGLPRLVDSGWRAGLAVTALIVLAALALWDGLFTHDFSFAYVAEHTSLTTPWYYRLSSLYSGQQGSLLYWALALSVFSAVVLVQNRRRYADLMPYVIATIMSVEAFFLIVLVFVASPFQRLANPPLDGVGLNPLLQDPGMLIHPPMLLAGLMSWTVPFAFAIAALATGRLGTEWIRATRRYALVAWCILGAGNLLGSWWSYHVLGWGGYWGWDPVENSAIMPWFVGTAYLHSVMVQERRGMLKVWNLGLVILAFSLAIFGTFVVRSGILTSVHSFAQSNIGPVFFAFLILVLVVSLGLLYWRLPLLQSEHGIESILSREAAFLLNNLLFVGIVLATFWGTILPLLSDALRGSKLTVGAPFFNQVNGPIALALVVLMGVGPLLPWRRAGRAQAARQLLMPVAGALLVAIALWVAGIRDLLPLIGLAASAFVVGTLIAEVWSGMAARRHRSAESYGLALARLVRRNNRRYGGYVVHLAIVLIGVGIIGSSFYRSEDKVILSPGQSARVAGFTLQSLGVQRTTTPDQKVVAASLAVTFDGQSAGEIEPSKIVHRNFEDQPPTTGVAIKTVRLKDLYVVLTDYGDDGRVNLLIFVNPLVSLIWLGGPLFLAGFLLCLWPEPHPRRQAAPVVQREILVEA